MSWCDLHYTEAHMKRTLGLMLKIAVTGVLLYMVVRQIPWHDKVYLLTDQRLKLGSVVSPENDAVRYLDSKGATVLAYSNRPVDLGGGVGSLESPRRETLLRWRGWTSMRAR